MAVRGNAAPRRQGREKALDTRDRPQLLFKDQCRSGTHRIEEVAGQLTAEPSLDRSGQGRAVLAETEDQSLLGRRREIGRCQAFAEDPREQGFAVYQDAVAVEDNE